MPESLCVLFSGGLDSCVLVGWLARTSEVHPLRIHYGLRWEEEERAAGGRFLEALTATRALSVRPLEIVEVTVPEAARPLWSLAGAVPGAESPDTAVMLPGRNQVLLDCAAEFCAARGLAGIALATLAGNPFADATPEFFAEQERRLFSRHARPLSIRVPFAAWRKPEVVRWGYQCGLPLEYSLSCLAPKKGGIHCGHCNKCAERRRAFREAGIADPTSYAEEPYAVAEPRDRRAHP